MVVTATIAEDDLASFSDLRERFFPGERNYLDAHVTLFHHIPAGVRQEFIAYAREHFRRQPTFWVEVQPPVSLGSGVAYPITAPELLEVRRLLRSRFEDNLTAQDLRPWKRPHITVQNKVTKEEARQLLRHLKSRFEPCRLRVLGLTFHRYDRGPWTELDRAAFTG
jgi:hypothetical protein